MSENGGFRFFGNVKIGRVRNKLHHIDEMMTVIHRARKRQKSADSYAMVRNPPVQVGKLVAGIGGYAAPG